VAVTLFLNKYLSAAKGAEISLNELRGAGMRLLAKGVAFLGRLKARAFAAR
jgi:hypothetical protein